MHGSDRVVIALNILVLAALCALACVLGGCQALAADIPAMWYRFPGEKPVPDGAYSPTILDLERHLPSRHGRNYWFADPITHAHETTHGINADLAGRHDKNWHAYYVLNNRCMYLPEPKVRMADVVRALPAGLRRGRFQLYLVDQVQRHPWWEVAPIKSVFDEWVSYTNGATAGLELLRNGKTLAADDRYFACLEFSAYALAVVRAVVELDPGFAVQHPEFGVFVEHELRRSLGCWRESLTVSGGRHRWDDAGLAKALTDGREAAPLREALVKLLGFDAAEEILDLCR